jgi:hypothetical protein
MEESIDHTEVFLCHARVYVFAKHFDIAHLRSFALENLETALQDFKPYTGRMCDIIRLAMFTYNNKNTANSKIGEELDPLRHLVVNYILCVYEQIGSYATFLRLIERGGPFARDIATMTCGLAARNKHRVRSRNRWPS